MDQVVLESRLEAHGDLDAHLKGLEFRNTALDPNQIVQRAFVHQFHGQIEPARIQTG